MRQICLALSALLLIPARMLAQQPVPDPNDKHRDAVLYHWEKAMGKLDSLKTTCKRTELKQTFNSVDVYEGEARMLRANAPNQPCRASLTLFKKDRPQVYEKYVCTGNNVYVYDPANKIIRFFDPGAVQGGRLNENNFLDFLFRPKAKDIVKMYKVTYVPPTDKFYYYLEIEPNNDKDRQSFVKARVAINATTFLPRQLWFKHPNRDEFTWDFPHMTPNAADVRPIDFATPQPERGWTMEKKR